MFSSRVPAIGRQLHQYHYRPPSVCLPLFRARNYYAPPPNHVHPGTKSWNKTTTAVGAVLLGVATVGYHQMDKKRIIRLDSELVPPPANDNQENINDEEIHGMASMQKLSFGTLAGICTGVFVRKGLSLLAFLFGGGFVFLQYLHSRSLIRIDWKNWSDRYESRLRSSSSSSSSTGVVGGGGGGGVGKGVVARFMDFLTSDFQYRSTFLVGFCLGLRM